MASLETVLCFDEVCDDCHGIGKETDRYGIHSETETCSSCQGGGYHMTTAGRHLAEFLWRWYGLKPAEVPRNDEAPPP